MVEDGAVTHPKIVERIRKAYKLTELEAEELMPLHRRPNGGDYDPTRYQSQFDCRYVIKRFRPQEETGRMAV